MLTVEYSNQAQKFLKESDKSTVVRVLKKIEELTNDPFPRGSDILPRINAGASFWPSI